MTMEICRPRSCGDSDAVTLFPRHDFVAKISQLYLKGEIGHRIYASSQTFAYD